CSIWDVHAIPTSRLALAPMCGVLCPFPYRIREAIAGQWSYTHLASYRCLGAGCFGAAGLLAALFFFAVAGFFIVAADFGTPTMSIVLIFTGSYGRLSRGSAALRAICFTSSTLSGVH